MTREKRRLGQGLAALLGTGLNDTEDDQNQPELRVHSPQPEGEDAPTDASADLLKINVGEIDDNPFQPRREFSKPEIASLSESLKEHDMLQPILVRRIEDRYQLISGERRLRAAIQAGWTTIPARVREADDRLVAELAIVENLQRKDLNPIEKALSFRRYLDEHNCPQEDLAKRLKIDRSTIANLLRLLELPEAVRASLQEGKITAGHARALLPLGDEVQQCEFSRRVIEEGLSVRATERLVSEVIEEEDGDELPVVASPARKAKKARSDQVTALEHELRVALGTKVEIRLSSRGRGKMVIHFANNEEFERLHDHMLDEPSQIQREAG